MNAKMAKYRTWDDTVVLSKEQWTSVLELAHMWGFERIRKRAVEKLDTVLEDAMQMISLGERYEITNWMLRGYEILAAREAPLTPDEGHQLGVTVAMKLVQVREERIAVQSRTEGHEMRSDEIGRRSYYCACDRNKLNWTEERMREIICDVFRLTI